MKKALAKLIFRSLLITGALVLLSHLAYAQRPVELSGKGGCTDVPSQITLDGVNFASLGTCAGTDNFGPFVVQVIVASSDSGTTCTAPDGSAGELFTNEFVSLARTYTNTYDQIWFDSTAGSTCFSDTTGVFGGTTPATVQGGTGRFAGATGTVSIRSSGSFLFNASGPPQTGFFARLIFTETGTITP